MSTHNIGFCGEIRKISTLFSWAKGALLGAVMFSEKHSSTCMYAMNVFWQYSARDAV